MKRTGEKVLIICSAIINILVLLLSVVGIIGFNTIKDNQVFLQETIDQQNATTMDTTITIDEVNDGLNAMEPFVSTVGYLIIAFLLISTILAFVGMVQMKKAANNKKAGIILIISGVFAGIVSLTSIFLYVAAIMLFVRKESVEIENDDSESFNYK